MIYVTRLEESQPIRSVSRILWEDLTVIATEERIFKSKVASVRQVTSKNMFNTSPFIFAELPREGTHSITKRL